MKKIKYVYGTYTDITSLLSLSNNQENLAIFTTEEKGTEARIKLGYRRKLYISNKAYLLWEKKNVNILEEIFFEESDEEGRFFDLPKFLKKKKVEYNLEQSGKGCIGKWNQSNYSWHAMVTGQGSAHFIVNYFHGKVYTLDIDFKEESPLLIGGREIRHIKIGDYPNNLNNEKVKRFIEELMDKPQKISWRKFAEYLKNIELEEFKKCVSIQYRTDSCVKWMGDMYSCEPIPWDNDTQFE